MSNFPKLIPAFTAHVVIGGTASIGAVARGGALTVVPFGTEYSFIRSEPGYPVQLDAVFTHGSDFIRLDPSGKNARLDVTSILKDKSGATLSFKYSGILTMTAELRAVLSGSPDAKTTGFGNAFTHILFETGDEKLRPLEQKIYVASGQFIIEAGKPTVVEYLISEVAAA